MSPAHAVCAAALPVPALHAQALPVRLLPVRLRRRPAVPARALSVLVAAVLVVTVLAGCASLPDPMALLRGGADAPAQADSAQADSTQAGSTQAGSTQAGSTQAAAAGRPAAAATPGAAPASAAVAAAAAEPPAPPVDARAQQAFDAARRAMRAGRHDDALRQFKALAQAYPDLGGVHANLGLLYRHDGKLAESAAELERAVQASPRQPVFHNQLGITYRQQGQFAKAREAYERAIALDARYAAPVLNLGILNDLYLQDRQRALALYDQYLVLAGGDAAVTKWVADLKNRKDKHVALQLKEKP